VRSAAAIGGGDVLSARAGRGLPRRLGHGDRVIVGIRDLLAEFPHAEPLVAAMMRALVMAGRAPAFVLVTSRNRLTPLVAVEGAHPISLDLMSAPEARTLLANRLGRHRVAAEPDAVQRIIEGCARLPSALATAAARAQHHLTPYKDHLYIDRHVR
jgi:hypothetical protein